MNTPDGGIPYIEPWPEYRDQAYEFDKLYLSHEDEDACIDDDEQDYDPDLHSN